VDARLAIELIAEADGAFTLRSGDRVYPDLRPALAGRHQIENARIALAAFERFAPRVGVVPDPDRVRRALAEVRWPGRLQWVRASAAHPELLLDGAHNPAGMRVLATHLRSLDRPPPVAVVGAMTGKLIEEMLATIAPCVAAFVVTRPSVERAESASVVAEEARRLGARRVEVVPEPAHALDRAAAQTGPGGYVLVTGSLYLVGQILALHEGRPVPGPVSL
jgi:dihydrofolate synthase/folylpolyglutamate synthase